MPGHSVRAERTIAAPPERVWEIITDLDFAAEVMSAIVKVERLEGEGYEVGVRWRETRRMFGREELTAVEARQGFLDRPVLVVLLASTAMVCVVFGLLLLGF